MDASRPLEVLVLGTGIIPYTSPVDRALERPPPSPAAAIQPIPNGAAARLNRGARPHDERHGKQIPLENGTGGIAMTTELEAILDSNLVTTVFLYGSAVMLIVSLAVVTWLGRSAESAMVLRTRVAS